jgi:hypothetical protein
MLRDKDFRQAAADKIRKIQAEMQEMVGELREIAEQTQDVHANTYVVAQLECLISDEHSWLSRDFNLTRWIEQLESDEETDS